MNTVPQQRNSEYRDHHYLSFLLRLWHVESPGGSIWQASLEYPGTVRRIGFASLEQLFAYLMDLTDSTSCPRKRAEEQGAPEAGDDSPEL